jgi:hypothetical protein
VDDEPRSDDGERAEGVPEWEPDLPDDPPTFRPGSRKPVPRIARSAAGGALAAAMLGLRDALEGPKEQEAIVIEAPGEPQDPEDFLLQLDFEHPERSRVILRSTAPPTEPVAGPTAPPEEPEPDRGPGPPTR